MKRLELDYTHVLDALDESEIFDMQARVDEVHSIIDGRTGAGSDYLGWLDLPRRMLDEEVADLLESAKAIRNSSDILVVIGIGGSYLGARAVIDALSHTFAHDLPQKLPKVYFAGHHISGKYLKELKEVLHNRDFSLNPISKSGTTTEPALAFRYLRGLLEARYAKDQVRQRIFATTDAKKGALRTIAEKEGYKTFVIPDDVGGRYSVLTAVGLLPIAAAGIDIKELLQGAADMAEITTNPDLKSNPAYVYAVIRYLLHSKGKAIEILANFDPALQYYSEWWKQLYGESEGKDHKSIFPASVNLSTDLHSMGQWIQEGVRNIFETFLWTGAQRAETAVPATASDLDGFNFLEGKTFDYVNQKAYQGVSLAHRDGEVPNMTVRIPDLNAYYLGQLIYFFEKACAMSGYLLEVNPFNQPGVEAYKTNMFALLGKKGYEEKSVELNERIKKLEIKVI